MLIVRAYLNFNCFYDLVNFFYVIDSDEEGLKPFLNLFDLFKQCKDFRDLLTEFVNHYQCHLISERMDEEDVDEWVDDMISRYETEIYRYTRDNQLKFTIRTIDLIDFTYVFMELMQEEGVEEIFSLRVEEIEVGKYGQITIAFEEDYLQY
mgnify:CR=1 FL=1